MFEFIKTKYAIHYFFLQTDKPSPIVKIIKPKNILEIGTFTGLSALTMGLAMDEKSKLTALDKNKETSDVAICDYFSTSLRCTIRIFPS